jgi:hypothetical protein
MFDHVEDPCWHAGAIRIGRGPSSATSWYQGGRSKGESRPHDAETTRAREGPLFVVPSCRSMSSNGRAAGARYEGTMTAALSSILLAILEILSLSLRCPLPTTVPPCCDSSAYDLGLYLRDRDPYGMVHG